MDKTGPSLDERGLLHACWKLPFTGSDDTTCRINRHGEPT
jgi:hypothetical protein